MSQAQSDTKAVSLPTDPTARKGLPIFTGCLDYFPDALLAVAAVSKRGNDQHNPGQPLHWSREKSSDHADTAGRHLIERGMVDVDGHRHTAKAAWRILALLQLEIEAAQKAACLFQTHQGGGMPVSADTKVDVEFRANGIGDCVLAGKLRWEHIGSGGDIVAWRVA